MTIAEFNSLAEKKAFEELFKCCGSTRWAKDLTSKRPFISVNQLKDVSDKIWNDISEEDILEAFTHHPKIGDVKSLDNKFTSTKSWASGEQSGVNIASHDTLERLAKGNEEYEKKYGYIFIVCATGKTAEEMLDLLESRIDNNFNDELKIAAKEQNKITHIRIDKLFT